MTCFFVVPAACQENRPHLPESGPGTFLNLSFGLHETFDYSKINKMY